MKTIIASIAAVAALTAVASPAAAQSYGYGHERWDRGYSGASSVNARQERIERQIERGVRSGQLTRGEAARLSAEARDIARVEARARYNGLSPRERAQLDRRLDRLEARLQYERHDNDYARRW